MTTVPKPTAITATAATMRRPWPRIRSDRVPPSRRKRRKSPGAKTAPPSPKTTSAGAAGSRGQANTPQAAVAAPTRNHHLGAAAVDWADPCPRCVGTPRGPRLRMRANPRQRQVIGQHTNRQHEDIGAADGDRGAGDEKNRQRDQKPGRPGDAKAHPWARAPPPPRTPPPRSQTPHGPGTESFPTSPPSGRCRIRQNPRQAAADAPHFSPVEGAGGS